MPTNYRTSGQKAQDDLKAKKSDDAAETALDTESLQDTSKLGSATPKPVAQTDEEDESKMSPMQKAAYRAKMKRKEQQTTADQATALRDKSKQ